MVHLHLHFLSVPHTAHQVPGTVTAALQSRQQSRDPRSARCSAAAPGLRSKVWYGLVWLVHPGLRSAMQFHKQGIATIPSRVSRVSDTLGTIYWPVFETGHHRQISLLGFKGNICFKFHRIISFLLRIICKGGRGGAGECDVSEQLFEALKMNYASDSFIHL